MRPSEDLTKKGQRRVEEIIEATLTCLARDGYAQTSLQRVANEAGMHKRAVLYYYGTREQLFDTVVRRLGTRLFDQMEQELSSLDEPAAIIEQGYATLWAAVTTDRALLVAWFGLRAEAVTNPTLAVTANYIVDRFRALVARLIDDLVARGRHLRVERGSLEVLVLACTQGLILDYLERGETPELRAAISDFQSWLATVTFQPQTA